MAVALLIGTFLIERWEDPPALHVSNTIHRNLSQQHPQKSLQHHPPKSFQRQPQKISPTPPAKIVSQQLPLPKKSARKPTEKSHILTVKLKIPIKKLNFTPPELKSTNFCLLIHLF